MKRYFLLVALCLTTLGFTAPIQDRKIDPKALAELTVALDIPQGSDVIAETQMRWLRREGTERWEIKEISPDQRKFVLNWATEQGLYADWKPAMQTYDKALILGATTSRMQMRLDYLKKLWNEGVRFKEIVWLTGDRPLDARADSLTERCATESEAARIIWEESDLPAEMRKLPVVYVAVPMKGEPGALKRPNTQDTLVAWLKVSPEPCKALFVSDQPFCGYQFAIVKGSLPDTIQFDLVGQGVDPNPHPAAAGITLDCIARWLYQESL